MREPPGPPLWCPPPRPAARVGWRRGAQAVQARARRGPGALASPPGKGNHASLRTALRGRRPTVAAIASGRRPCAAAEARGCLEFTPIPHPQGFCVLYQRCGRLRTLPGRRRAVRSNAHSHLDALDGLSRTGLELRRASIGKGGHDNVRIGRRSRSQGGGASAVAGWGHSHTYPSARASQRCRSRSPGTCRSFWSGRRKGRSERSARSWREWELARLGARDALVSRQVDVGDVPILLEVRAELLLGPASRERADNVREHTGHAARRRAGGGWRRLGACESGKPNPQRAA